LKIKHIVGLHQSGMITNSSTQEEWTIHALNIHGVFFERRCATLISNTPEWKVISTNYPVEYPPPNGFLRGKESSLDIWARRGINSDFVVDVLVECKKANPEFVNWIFFPKPNCEAPSEFTFTSVDNQLNENSSAPWTIKCSLRPGKADISIASDAREVRGNYTSYPCQKQGKTKTSNAAIQEAAYQVALACRAVVHEDISLLEKACTLPEDPSPPWVSKYYIPIIVTTAKLFSVDFLPQLTNIDSGEIDLQDATLIPVKSILYEYALPKHLQVPLENPLEILKSGRSEILSRMYILVVHAEELSDSLSNLFKKELSDRL
jgi:hypothetical protein